MTKYYRSDTVMLLVFMVGMAQHCLHVANSLSGWWAAGAYLFCLLFTALFITLLIAAEEEKAI